ncbi:MAG: thiamine pyrophosphate-binding protein [Oribacterium sp.]|nr:thiamine pyrophosphate-binding protein [Oribacterium sp.]
MERVADCVIRKINEAGCNHVFLISGRGILYLTDAVAKNNNITPIHTYHEQGAAYAAMAYSSASGGVSACLISTGCAATNAVTACLCAYQDNLPLVFISGNNPLKENTRHTGERIRTYGSQEADIISVVESITKYAVMLEDSDSAVYEIEKAIFIAQDGRKGPVWIDIPLDVQNMKIDESKVKHFVHDKEYNLSTEESVRNVVDGLNNANRPILLIGGGARDAFIEIQRLVEGFKIPLVFSPAAADIYGSSHELSIGAIGSIGGTRAGNFAIQNSDYVLAVGTKLCSQLTGVKDNFARDAKIVVVDIDENEHRKIGVHIEHVIISDAVHFLRQLLQENLVVHNKSWIDKCVHWKSVFSIENEAFINELKEKNQIDLYSLMNELSPVLPNDATIITDAGFEELIVPSSIKYSNGQRCLFPATQGAMGYAIPAIIGAYEAGRKNIICIVGDGSVMMNIQELQMISALNIPMRIFVINNDMYAVIRRRQKDLFRTRTIGNDPSDGVPAPNFESIARCFGFDFAKINNRTELIPLLSKLKNNNDDKKELIEVMCVSDQKYFHESYAINEKRKLVHRPIEDLSPFLPRKMIKDEMVIPMMEE